MSSASYGTGLYTKPGATITHFIEISQNNHSLLSTLIPRFLAVISETSTNMRELIASVLVCVFVLKILVSTIYLYVVIIFGH